MPTTDRLRRQCLRCDCVVDAEYDQPQLRRWVRFYPWLGVPFIPLSPIIGSDYVVMLPLTMFYLVGLGPALGFLREPPKCCTCGAVVSHKAEEVV
jgi:hypothetical protein